MSSKTFTWKCGIVVATMLMQTLLLLPTAAAIDWAAIGPEGGPINALQATPEGLYAGTYNGVFKLPSGGGTTWLQVTPTLPPASAAVYSLAHDPTGAVRGVLYAGTANGVHKHVYGNPGWLPVGTGLPSSAVFALHRAVTGPFSGTLFAGVAAAGVYKLSSDGTTWDPVGSGLSQTVYAIVSLANGNLYAAANTGVFVLPNGGTTWTALVTGLPTSYISALVGDSGGTLYAGTNAGVFRLPAGSTTWQDFSSGMPGTRVNSLAFDDLWNLYAGTMVGAYKLPSGSTTWGIYGTGLPNFAVRAVAGLGDYMYAGTDGGAFYGAWSSPGWTEVNAGLRNVRAFAFARAADGTLYVGTWRSGVFNLPNGSTTWGRLHLGLPIPTYATDLAVDDSGTLFLATDGNGIYRLLSGSTTWQAMNTGLGIMMVYSLVHRTGDGLYAGTALGVYRLPSGTTTWTSASAGLGSAAVSALAVDTESTLYAGISSAPGVYRLLSGGAMWEPVGTVWCCGSVQGIVRSANGTLFAGTTSGVATLPSGGTTWTTLDTGLTQNWVQALVMDVSGILYAGTHGGGVFRLIPGTTTWEAITTDTDSLYVRALLAGPITLYSGTDGAGAFSASLLPDAAALISPSGAIGDSTPAFTWERVPEALQYTLLVQTLVGTKVLDQTLQPAEAGCLSGAGPCVYAPTTPLSGGTYQWFIRTWNGAGYGPWSSPLQFTYSPAPPPAATLASPSGSIAVTSPTYTWVAVGAATWYYLWVADSTGTRLQQWYAASTAGCGSGTGTCSVTPPTILAPGAATWWVQTWNETGYGPWSSGMAFTVPALGVPPAVTTLTSPTGTIGVNTPTYIWSAAPTATWYLLWVNDATGGGKLKLWYPASALGCGSGTCSVTPSTPLAAGPATWWVQTWNPLGYGPWSAGMGFTVPPVGVPPAVTALLAPTGTVGTPTPTYTWTAVPTATWYYLWVTDNTGTKIQQWYPASGLGCASATCSVTPTTPLVSGGATWWVQTWNPNGYGPWSAGQPFTVGP